ncbi:MAG TPA: hypothetical protein VKD91_18995 [Pyrinomonadaceae bacterium]|nr:hypothetical protein [Pyrinomonadaceae bacterium]
MIKTALLAIAVLVFANSITAQDTGSVRCVATIYRLRGESWKLIRSVKFSPKLGEEELTNRRIHLSGTTLSLLASVFPTDESMHSAKGADSIKLGLAISAAAAKSAFDVDNNAVAEGTLATLDTLRVERTSYVSRRPMLARLECWDSNLEKER